MNAIMYDDGYRLKLISFFGVVMLPYRNDMKNMTMQPD